METIQLNTSSKTPTLCLNMIVKNESKIITRLLTSVLPIIDCYCICDTGSTDNTCELIKDFFKQHNISGKIITMPFKNFEYNRTFSLKNCIGMSDYILLMDADMVLDIGDFNKNMLLKSDSFFILQGSEFHFYQNMRIVKNNGLYKYMGVTHEYIETPNNNTTTEFDKSQLFIKDYGDGGSKSDKFERDVLLLTNALKEDPTNVRYHFYLANSYHDLGQYENAIELYLKRIKLNGWNQEVWYSYYRIGLCYKNLGKMADAIYYWLEGYNYLPERLESLYEIIHYYRNSQKYKLIDMIYKLCKVVISNNLNRNGYLFLANDVYLYKIFYEYTIFAYYIGIFNINDEIIIVLNNCIDPSINNNLLTNMKHYKYILQPTKTIDFNITCNTMIGSELTKMKSSSASIVKYENNQYLMNIRMVNYTIDNNGYYNDCDKHIVTTNRYVILTDDFTIVKQHEFQQDYIDRKYIGIEDIRIYQKDSEYQYIGTGYHSNNNIGIVYGKYDLNSDKIVDLHEIHSGFNNNSCEKNWVFTEYNESTHIIYKWFPLQICKLDEDTHVIRLVKERQMPRFFAHSRGSTCGYKYGSEIWFVLHVVSYEQPRHYYHFIAVFDVEMKLLKYSAPFKFKGEPIEYCIGLIVEDDRVLMTYSCWDRTTQLAVYDKSYINEIVKYNL